MEIENMLELNNNIENDMKLEKKQNNFLDSMLGKAINTGLDIGLRAVLPDLIEDQIINIKDNFLKFGFKEGLSKTIEEAINIGKSGLGIITGNFENISQMQLAVKNGGILDSTSKIFDIALNKMNEKGVINSNISDLIKHGKNSIFNNIESNIEKSFSNQVDIENNLEKHINNWKTHYKNQDFNNMEKEYKKIEKELSTLVPLENTIKEARTIENIHSLIKSNGQNFNLTETQQELLKKLS